MGEKAIGSRAKRRSPPCEGTNETGTSALFEEVQAWIPDRSRRSDNPNHNSKFGRHAPMEFEPDDIPDCLVPSCFPVTLQPEYRSQRAQQQFFADGNSLSTSCPDAVRPVGCLPPIRVSCRKVSSAFGVMVASVLGFQPVLIGRVQNVWVMRHGERMDAVMKSWSATALRPWDPPLTHWGKWQSLQVGCQLRDQGCRATRVVCSPYLRCIQSACELAKGLSSDAHRDESAEMAEARWDMESERGASPIRSEESSRGVAGEARGEGMQVDPPRLRRTAGASSKPSTKRRSWKWSSRRRSSTRWSTVLTPSLSFSGEPQKPVRGQVKVSIDFGLCEVAGSVTDPGSHDSWLPPIEELEDMIREQGLVVDSHGGEGEAVRSLPVWPESADAAMLRYLEAIDRISKQFMDEDIIIVTHAEAVQASVIRCQKGMVKAVKPAAFSHLHRTVYHLPTDANVRGVGEWKLEIPSDSEGIVLEEEGGGDGSFFRRFLKWR
eukprot:TRINITY_DN21416_c5_g1_i1.p1 TRINITY_DN21416_c5_g1~~TRINITY_DN21416_c5_g1_i1.p1  ORF type:complete len:491 (-),score=51.74 TRINITY_DN21416_c5_g1_i1:2033-3505(-)